MNSNFSPIKETIKAFGNGEMVIVIDDQNRENEGDLVIAGEHISPEMVNFMMKNARGLICSPIDRQTAERLKLPSMVEQNNEYTRCNFTVSIDSKKNTTTGISASDRAATIKALVSEDTMPDDMLRPGHIFPIVAEDEGVLQRPGHTEAAIDLCRLSGLRRVAVICEIINDNGEMARPADLFIFAQKHNLPIISIEALINYRKSLNDISR